MKRHETEGLTILWRGSLASCNYGCSYCPFAKTEDNRDALRRDRNSLKNFAQWVSSRPYNISILFTPWGEALIRNYYRQELSNLSHMANVKTVAIQTNLSCSIEWLHDANLRSLALWITYHPGETPKKLFLEKIHRLAEWNVRHSVGIVGLKNHFDEAKQLREALPQNTYLWINAYMPIGQEEHQADYYTENDVALLSAIDPYFELNNVNYQTFGKQCFTGETVISVGADGSAKRCHFIDEPLGNIFDEGFEDKLHVRPCTNQSCSCHIGYSHLKNLDLRGLFGSGFLERRPQMVPHRSHIISRLQRFADAN